MGLDDLPGMDAEQNVGGRPPQDDDEDDFSSKDVNGKPYYQQTIQSGDEVKEVDDEGFWQSVYDQFVSGDELTDDELARICDYTHTLPWTVREKLDEHGIHELKEEHIRDDYPSRMLEDDKDKSGSTTELDPDSGLGALID